MNVKHLSRILTVASLIALAVWYWQIHTVRMAPNVQFKTIKGETIQLAKLQGKPVLVTFWATDCRNCIEEMPHLIDLHQKYSPNGLKILAVAMYYDPPNHVIGMAESKQLPYAIVLDPDGQLARAFGNIRLTPTTFLLDRQGHIVMQKTGVFDLADMQKRIERL